jgi:hypothetical protein
LALIGAADRFAPRLQEQSGLKTKVPSRETLKICALRGNKVAIVRPKTTAVTPPDKAVKPAGEPLYGHQSC